MSSSKHGTENQKVNVLTHNSENKKDNSELNKKNVKMYNIC